MITTRGPGSLIGLVDDEEPDVRRVATCAAGHPPYSPDVRECPRCRARREDAHFREHRSRDEGMAKTGRLGGLASAARAKERR